MHASSSLLTFRRHLVARALDEVSHGASSRDRVSHSGRGDGVHEARLPGICEHRDEFAIDLRVSLPSREKPRDMRLADAGQGRSLDQRRRLEGKKSDYREPR